jgi:hypothetical protein
LVPGVSFMIDIFGDFDQFLSIKNYHFFSW